jgi:CheY-like chemotaxis protein
MKPRALVVEDDDRIIGSIEDSLFSIGHEHDWVTNQHDAQEKLRDTEYTYVLLDLQIPAKPNRGGADKEFGCNLLKDIQQIKGPGRIPVIVMTGYSADCLDLSTELSRNGASDFISKPFLNKGRTLSSVIRQVLSVYPETVSPEVPSVAECLSLRSFSGGELLLFEDRAELCGVVIMSDMGAGHSLKILNVLTQQDGQGRFVRRSGEELATAIGIAGQAGTVGGCVRRLRENVTRRLERHLNLSADADAIIRNDSQGYFLNDWISVGDPNSPRKTAIVTGAIRTAPGDRGGKVVAATSDTTGDKVMSQFNERQEWVLREIRKGTQLQRVMLEKRFCIHSRTAKRDLAELTLRGLIEYVGDGRSGHYTLRATP